MDFVSQAVTLKNFGHLKARVTDYNALDEMYTAQVYGWRLAGGNIVRVFAKRGVTSYQTLCNNRSGGTCPRWSKRSGEGFSPLEGMYCVEVLAKKSGNQSVGSTVVYCKEKLFNTTRKMMTLRIKIPKEPMSILNQNALHTMHTLKNFSRT